MLSPTRWAPELAEAIATFALVLVGCGAIMAGSLTGAPGALGIALAFTFVITVMVYATGHVSGAHINPAITLAFAATGHFPWRRVPSYMLAQGLGAWLAALALDAILGPVAGLGATHVAAGLTAWQGLLLEALATGLLAFVIASVATDGRAEGPAAGLAIGLAVGMGALFIGPLTGGSLNPARSLGPAVVAGDLTGLWVYLVGPALGAAIAMGLYELVRLGHVPGAAGTEAPSEPLTEAEVVP